MKNTTTATTAPKAAFNRVQALALASETLTGGTERLEALAAMPGGRGSWAVMARKFLLFLSTGIPEFTIFAKGNSKLPFSAFSSLPLFDCPGAGACKDFCYSLTAWRYPAAFFRQLQNSYLLRSEKGKATITGAFNRLPAGTLRLYVDGDFFDKATVFFWMELIGSRPDIQAYGYSKSWKELVAAHLSGIAWPANYQLNLSSGSVHSNVVKELIKALPIARGEFIALPIDRVHISNRSYQGPTNPGFPAYQKAVQASAEGQRVFVCKGRCGACLPSGDHACGSSKFKGVTIAIGVH